MENQQIFLVPNPIIDSIELDLLDRLSERYKKLIQPSHIKKIGSKAVSLIPSGIKDFVCHLTDNISEQKIYMQAMTLIATGFQTIEELAAKYTIFESSILKTVNCNIHGCEITKLEYICFARSYDVAKAVNSSKTSNKLTAFTEGGATGFFGLGGLLPNLVLSTLLYFRAVQAIAMFYGYDVKNNSEEMFIASDVFSSALSPTTDSVNNEMSGIISKFMILGQASLIKQTTKKGWTAMAQRGGIPLLLTQIRALAHKSAANALEKAGEKGIENIAFKHIFETLGKKLTQKAIGKMVPVASSVLGALIDTAQMNKVLEYADIFYHKRFISEKNERINAITHMAASQDIIIPED